MGPVQPTLRSLPSQLQMVPAPVNVSPLLTSHGCCPVTGAPAQAGTGWYRHVKEASSSSVVTTLQAALLAGYRGPLCSPKILQEVQTGGHSWLCFCSPGDPFFFPNTLPPQTGNRLPLDRAFPQRRLPTFFFQKLQSELQNLKNTLNVFFFLYLKNHSINSYLKRMPIKAILKFT